MPNKKKNTTTKQINKNTTKRKAPKSKSLGIRELFGQMRRGDTTRFIIGLVLICLALFLFVSFISFVINGKEDAVNMENITSNLPITDTINNKGGILGLRAANYFMQEGFGFTAIFIPIFMLLLALKLMKTHFFRITQQFINCTFLMVWGSILLGYLFPDGLSNFKPGGDHGLNLSHMACNTIGDIGLVMALAITMIVFFIYLTSKTIEFIRKLMHPEVPIKMLKEQVKKHKLTEIDTTMAENDATDGLCTPNGDPNDVNADEENDYSDEERSQVIDLGSFGDENEPMVPSVGNDGLNGSFQGHNNLDNGATDGSTQPFGNDYNAHNHSDMASDGSYNDLNNANNAYAAGNNAFSSANGDPNATNGAFIEPNLEIEEIVDEETGDNNFNRGSLDTPYDPKLDFENYQYPTVDLLKKYADQDSTIDMQEQQANKERIITVLRNFGVEISSIKATVGPTITLYEITPAKGVRIAKIRNLEDDIALSLSAIGIRIIAPIPGKGTIGIEVPNAKPKIVSMESVINSRKFQDCTYELPIALGRTITNEIYIQDLTKCPHLLVAGATGQGKSVGLNAIITSLLYKKHPSELKFVLVDPKKVEFSVYAPLENNFMAEIPESESDPVITNTDRVKHTLKSLCQEMDDRYMLLKSAFCRNIKEYNEKFCARRLNPHKGHRFLPYIVVIIDEYGDLIMVAGKEIEHPITRIAQLARAVGIHMVIATQRPTTNIITGNIKANFPARMAFRVMASVDSRTILDRMGANQLIGRGDMLFLASGKQVERVQCAFVDTPEVEAINSFISEQYSPLKPYILPEVAMDDEGGAGESGDGDNRIERYDSMFVDVARFVVNGQQGSTSAIQRTFAIGYNRAGRLMDQLEKAKIVGPARGSKPRDVLIFSEDELNAKLVAMNLL